MLEIYMCIIYVYGICVTWYILHVTSIHFRNIFKVTCSSDNLQVREYSFHTEDSNPSAYCKKVSTETVPFDLCPITEWVRRWQKD